MRLEGAGGAWLFWRLERRKGYNWARPNAEIRKLLACPAECSASTRKPNPSFAYFFRCQAMRLGDVPAEILVHLWLHASLRNSPVAFARHCPNVSAVRIPEGAHNSEHTTDVNFSEGLWVLIFVSQPAWLVHEALIQAALPTCGVLVLLAAAKCRGKRRFVRVLCWREGGRERERETDRQTDRQRQTDTQRERAASVLLIYRQWRWQGRSVSQWCGKQTA